MEGRQVVIYICNYRICPYQEHRGRHGAIKPLVGLGCSPVLVSGTKKLFLKWIGRALRKNRTQVPDSNGAVCWNLANTFFPVGGMTRREGAVRS
jgi:hypothetical protein